MDQETLVEQLRALGEPTRLAVAMRLADREWGGTELLEAEGVSQPNLSRHLKVLREAGMVLERKTGRNAYYQLGGDLMAEVVRMLSSPEGERRLREFLGSRAKNIQNNASVNSVSPLTPRSPEPAASSDIEEWLL